MSETSGDLGKLTLIYFVADESASMQADTTTLHSGLTSLLNILRDQNPYIAALVRFSIIGFNERATVHLPASDLRHVERMPSFTARDLTSYVAPFAKLQEVIPEDIRRLQNANYQVSRPIVFFLTDGQPNQSDEDWESELDALTAPTLPYAPSILAFGVRDANEKTIARVATQEEYAFIIEDGYETGSALLKFIHVLGRTIIGTVHASTSGSSQLQIEPPEGFRGINIDINTMPRI